MFKETVSTSRTHNPTQYIRVSWCSKTKLSNTNTADKAIEKIRECPKDWKLPTPHHYIKRQTHPYRKVKKKKITREYIYINHRMYLFCIPELEAQRRNDLELDTKRARKRRRTTIIRQTRIRRSHRKPRRNNEGQQKRKTYGKIRTITGNRYARWRKRTPEMTAL